MPPVPSSPHHPDRHGGATQNTPEPGTSGRMNERDNRRILRIVVVLLVAVVLGVVAFNAVWWRDSASTLEAPVPAAPAQNANTPSGAEPAPR